MNIRFANNLWLLKCCCSSANTITIVCIRCKISSARLLCIHTNSMGLALTAWTVLATNTAPARPNDATVQSFSAFLMLYALLSWQPPYILCSLWCYAVSVATGGWGGGQSKWRLDNQIPGSVALAAMVLIAARPYYTTRYVRILYCEAK